MHPSWRKFVEHQILSDLRVKYYNIHSSCYDVELETQGCMLYDRKKYGEV